MQYYERLFTIIFNHCERLCLALACGFLVRCLAVEQKWSGVPRMWVIDTQWYLTTALGVMVGIILYSIMTVNGKYDEHN